MNKKRYFIAIPIPINLAKIIDNKISCLNNIKQKTKLDKYHITILFIGDYEQNIILKELDDFKFSKFNIETSNICSFNHHNNSKKTYYISINKNETLNNLYLDIAKRLSKIKEFKQEFTPHITLFKASNLISLTMDKYKFIADKVILYNSNLETDEYEIIKEYNLTY